MPYKYIFLNITYIQIVLQGASYFMLIWKDHWIVTCFFFTLFKYNIIKSPLLTTSKLSFFVQLEQYSDQFYGDC